MIHWMYDVVGTMLQRFSFYKRFYTDQTFAIILLVES